MRFVPPALVGGISGSRPRPWRLTLPLTSQIHYGSDSWNDPGGPNLYGNLKQLHLLKQRHRSLKVLLSIGGWTYSENGRFARPISSPAGRARFVESAVALVADYGLDGLDVDFEYPQDDAQARDYVELLRGLREGLDALQQRLGMAPPHGFELTVAAVRRPPRAFLGPRARRRSGVARKPSKLSLGADALSLCHAALRPEQL